MATVIERVARGAAVLDTFVPDWLDRINPATLAIEDGRDCMLGQLFGGYPMGLASLKMAAAWGGGETVNALDCGFMGVDYAALTEAWRDLIARRRLATVQRQQRPVEERELVAA